ncbi:unnamed protein product [Notodromas monacha]|uniref:Uncharacterized protein n=1 Tax=Notodromas monacha TaxID=399045 RepID=A0A7R9BZF1_9CRUS|nr:unnamed protein product [Notodromas monacha]CAG0922932.1 unnamed protein product [Notodromas monacha]
MIVERLIVLVAALMETRLVVAANYAYSVRRPAWARRDLEPVAQMSHAANGVFRHQFRPKIPGLAEPRAARSEQPPPEPGNRHPDDFG